MCVFSCIILDGRNFTPAGRSSPLLLPPLASTASAQEVADEAPQPPQPPHNLTPHTPPHCHQFREFPPAGSSTTDNNNSTMHALTQSFYADPAGTGGGEGNARRMLRKDDGTDRNGPPIAQEVEQGQSAGLETTIERQAEAEQTVNVVDDDDDDGVYEDSLVNHASVSASPNLSVDANVYENSFIKAPNERKSVERDLEQSKQFSDRGGLLRPATNNHSSDSSNQLPSDKGSGSSVINGSGNNNPSLDDNPLHIMEKGGSSSNQHDQQLQSYVPVYKHSITSMGIKSLHSGSSNVSSGATGMEAFKGMSTPTRSESLREKDVTEHGSENYSDQEDIEKGADDGEDIFEYTDEDLDEALQQAEQPEPELSSKGNPSAAELLSRRALDDELSLQIMEGHYMPMTPRRTVISSASSCTTLSLMNASSSNTAVGGKLRPCESLTAMDILDSIQKGNGEMQICNAYDESTYIEMTKGTHGKSVFATADELRGTTYEMIMVRTDPASRSASGKGGSGGKAGEFGQGKNGPQPPPPPPVDSEPLYMELSQLHSNINALKDTNRALADEATQRDAKKQDSVKGGPEGGQTKILTGGGTESTIEFGGEKTSTMVRMKNAMSGGGNTAGSGGGVGGNKKKKKDKNWPDIVMQSSKPEDSDSESDTAGGGDKVTDDCKRIAKKKHGGKEKKHLATTNSAELQSKTMARSRFSLSDTFRPASYYLGASGSSNNTPFGLHGGGAGDGTFDSLLDSSDSDIVSPPPIPITSLPLDEPDGTGGGGGDEGRVGLLGPGIDFARYADRERFRSSEAIDLIRNHHAAQQEKRQSVQSLVAGTSSGGQSLAGSMNLSYGMRRESGSISSNRSSLRSSSQGLFNSSGVAGKPARDSLAGSGADRYDGVSHASSEYELLLRETGANGGRTTTMGANRDNSASARSSITLSETSGSIEWRSRSCMDVSMRNKRRPISGSSINCPIELALDGCEIASAEVDRYSHSVGGGGGGGAEMNSNSSNFSQNGHDNSIYYENVDMPGPPPHGSSESIGRTSSSGPILSPLREKNLSLHDARCQSEYLGTVLEGHSLDVENASVLSSALDPDQQSSCTLRGDYERTNQCNRTITPIEEGGVAHSVVAEPLHSRNNSTLSSEGAPYYYSDLQARAGSREDDRVAQQHSRQLSSERCGGPTATITQPGDTLNNQRDPGGLRKPTTGSIFHIHNPLNNTLKAANLLLHASATEKHADIDRKNIYESDRIGQKDVNKTIAASLAAGGSRAVAGRSGSSLSMATSKDGSAVNVRQSTGSLGGGYTGVVGGDGGAYSAGNGDPAAGCSSSSRRDSVQMQQMLDTSGGNISSGDQLWEEDTLWRDNLRRVSHIHAKSMDNLDHLGTIRSPSSAALLVKTINQQQQQQQQEQREMQDQRLRDAHQDAAHGEETNPKPIVKINRKDVTYVNEHLAHLPVSKAVFGEQSLSAAAVANKSILRTPLAIEEGAGGNGDDDDVYVQLASNVSSSGTIVRDGRWSSSSGRDSDAVYEVLRDEINRYDINRETIRQWDLMSSGLVNSSNSAGGSTSRSGGNNSSETYHQKPLSAANGGISGKPNAQQPAMESAGDAITLPSAGTRSLAAKQYYVEACEKPHDVMSVSSLNSGKHSMEDSKRKMETLRDKYNLDSGKHVNARIEDGRGVMHLEDSLNVRKNQ